MSSGTSIGYQTYQAVIIDLTIHKDRVPVVAKRYGISRTTVREIERLFYLMLRLRKKFYGL